MDDTLNSAYMPQSKTVEWETPQDLFDKLNKYYNFDIDVCASDTNCKVSLYFTKQVDGLQQKWFGKCWMNPPYGREIYGWVKKAYEESLSGVVTVALLPSRTDVRWFHEFCYKKPNVNITFLKGRLKFGGCTDCAPFPNMIVVFAQKDTDWRL